MSGIIGKKVGMTSVFDDDGTNVPVTVVEAEPNVVTQVKTAGGPDGYDAVQLGVGEAKAKRTSKALLGHFDKAGTGPKEVVREFRNFNDDLEEPVERGEEIRLGDLFVKGELVDVVGTSKGRGFQGVVKRHDFSGVGMQTHGQSDVERAPGSIGAASDPSRVFPGMKMGGRMGGERTKTLNLEVVRIIEASDLILIKGSVPGPKEGYVEIHRK
ncbi:MAG: 50S ribosomal protein L3 [Bacteroidetes bacterium QS_8_68_28]|jgi:large subunit ribosomal protein L3|nr:MAG: 50S ribosomal protein L3 [Bacteroidetes bacterium QS_8_68_28]